MCAAGVEDWVTPCDRASAKSDVRTRRKAGRSLPPGTFGAMDKSVALVTGASKGIGNQIARQLTAAGLTVYAGSRDAAVRWCISTPPPHAVQPDATPQACARGSLRVWVSPNPRFTQAGVAAKLPIEPARGMGKGRSTCLCR